MRAQQGTDSAMNIRTERRAEEGGTGMSAALFNTILEGRTIVVRKNSTGTEIVRPRLNLIEGTGVAITIADDSVETEADITFSVTSAPTTPLSVVTTISPYTLSDADDVVLVDTLTAIADVTVTLHDPATAKQKPYNIKLIEATHGMILDGDGAFIDGAATQTTAVLYTSFTLIPDNASSRWFII